MSGLLGALRAPVSAEKRALLAARWASLPEDLRQPWQVVGRHHVHCGYTMGAAFCSFGCTHCYLPKNANRAPLPSFEEMRAEIDAQRRLVGEGGAIQLTGGDLVDAYLRAGRPDELVALTRYACDAGLVPMLMTHGQGLLDEPSLLVRLARDGGLRKLAVHVDVTQAGRPGFPFREVRREADLHPLRDAFVDLLERVRRETGKRLVAAHTVTVTERNLGDLGDLVRWLIDDRRRLRAFRLLSLQPEADVGRTLASARPATAEATWAELEKAVGRSLPHGVWFGHPACSRFAALLVLYPSRRTLLVTPADAAGREYWGRLLDVFAGLGSRGDRPVEALARRLALVARRPSIVLDTVRWARARLAAEGLSAGSLLAHALRGRAVPFHLALHDFMDEAAVRSADPTVKSRLAACSFRGAVRRGDAWEAVPMCAMNALERQGIYARAIAGGTRKPV